jgi:hypothetical protein
MFKVEKAWVEADYINLLLTDKKIIKFPKELNKKLKNASFTQLSNIEITCNGTGLHWPDLDEDLSVLGLMEGRFGVD